MKTKREVYVAIGVAIFMILLCFFLYFFTSKKETNVLDIKVYKLNTLEDESYEYRECFIGTDVKLDIDKLFKNVTKLSDNKQLSGVGINGDYKIVSGDRYLAFDGNNDGKVYDGERNKVFTYSSDLYEKIVTYCGQKEGRMDEKNN